MQGGEMVRRVMFGGRYGGLAVSEDSEVDPYN